MSLLLQALQKAAKSREEGEADLTAEDIAMAGELSLEPDVPARSSTRESASAPVSPASAQAATVIQAQAGGVPVPGFSPMDYAREHYMLAIVGGAILLALCYGAYIYIQISHPFRSSPQAAPPVAAVPPPVASPQSTPDSAKISGLPAVAASASAPSPTASATAPSAKANSEKAANTTAVAMKDASADTRFAAKGDVAPKARKRIAFSPSVTDTPPLIDASDSIETVTVPTSHRASAGDTKTTNGIAVRRDEAGLVPVSATLMQAYETLQSGDSARAKGLYEAVLQSDPRSIDALLGLAAIALNEGRIEDANRYYRRVLDLEPRNAYAQAGLISIAGGADPQASESRLKQLIARDPSAFLYFSLGNLYAEQSQWPAAEQAYFQAFQMQSDNPDYAFNLAIGLEHIGQNRLALEYYRKALDLSFKKGRANFDQSLVIQRVGQLSTRVGQ